jgi:signal transduction histidine kinase
MAPDTRIRAPIIGWRLNVVRHDGVEITCDWSLTPLVNVDNRVVSVIVQWTRHHPAAGAERIKQEFTSTLSHELRTPLTSIIGSLQLINSGVMATSRRTSSSLPPSRNATASACST